MSKLRVGIVGLGGIAQKAYLPVLSGASDWTLAGAFSPNQEKTEAVCAAYRIAPFAQLGALAAQCDAVFVHSSTASHFQVVSDLLDRGVHVYVDKPLAETVEQAERLVALADQLGKVLMVGFNRRFAPRYRQLRERMCGAASLRMDKHRCDSVGPRDLRFTLLDDYLHVVDTALWLASGSAELQGGTLQTNEAGQLLYAEHHFRVGEMQVTTSMHRRAGSDRESVRIVTDGALYQVNDMRQWQSEQAGLATESPAAPWQSTLEQRGFAGAVRHFITAVSSQSRTETSGEQAVAAQRIIEQLLRDRERC